MTLLSLVPIWAAITAACLASIGLWACIRLKVLSSAVDPCVMVLFQVGFTFWLLILLGLLPVGDAIGYFVFFGVMLVAARERKHERRRAWISEKEWITFSYVVFALLVLSNAYLISQKGFLLLEDDLLTTRQVFYEQWGIFKRLNELGVGVIGISAFYLWRNNEKKTAAAYLLFTCYLILSLGSRSGLVSLVFLYGAYARFYPGQLRAKTLIIVIGLLSVSSLVLFYLMFREQFLVQFGVRLLSYGDGPIYFFFCDLPGKVLYGPGYAFDNFLVAARLRSAPAYLSLGRVLNWHFLRMDNPLTGPNPQFCVESHVMFGPLYLIWYGFVAFAFAFLRRKMATPFSYFVASMVVGPLLIDSQFASSQVFTFLLGIVLLLIVRYVRRTLILATTRCCSQSPVDNIA